MLCPLLLLDKYMRAIRNNIGYIRIKNRAVALVLCLGIIVGSVSGCATKDPQTQDMLSQDVELQDAPSQDAALQDNPSQDTSSQDISYSDIYNKEVFLKNARLTETVDDNYRNFYEIFVGSFYDSDGDGVGDLQGIIEKLDYISALGCNGIWLTPMMTAPSYHKYDTIDYYQVDPAFGGNQDFELLAKNCHDKNIRLIIDLVINHSSSEHPWFKDACEYLRNLPENEDVDLEECPYVDYYNFSREKINASYREVPGTDWFYEAVFDYSQPDLNLYNSDLKVELMNVAKFWIDLGVDGFRMDAVMHYDESDLEFNTQFLNDYFEYCKSLKPDFYMVSEVWASEQTIADYYGSNTPSFFNFDAADVEGKLIKAGRGNLNAEKFVKACEEYQNTFGQTNPEYIDAPFITNHDMGRVANAVMSDPVTLKMTAGLLSTMQGSPFIYYGEEIGMKSKGKKDENKRLHMNWSSKDEAGICKDPAGADSNIEQSFASVEEQMEDGDSILYFYQKAFDLRNSNPEVARGVLEVIDELTSGDVAVTKRTWNESSIYIAYNTGDSEAQFELNDVSLVGAIIATGVEPDELVSEDGKITIPSKSILYLK